jgi:putative thioredoxin
MSGAVDLSAVKARADAARDQSSSPIAGAGEAPGAGGSGEIVIDVTEAGFQGAVERSTQVPVIFDLRSERSSASAQLSPILANLAREGGGAWVLARVDLDAHPQLAQAFGVQSAPTLVAVANGQPVQALQDELAQVVQRGVADDALRQWVSSLLDQLRERLPGIAEAEQATPPGGAEPAEEPEDPRFTTAEESLAAGDYDAAAAAYQQILDAEPGNEQARLGQAQARFAGRAAEVDPSVVMRAGDAPDDLTLQCQAADYQIAHQDVEGGFNRLIEAVRRSSGAEREKARDQLLGIFELFPADDERVAKARRNLASALF